MRTRQLGRIDYESAYKLQLELVRKRIDNKIDDTLLLLEHPSVIVKGRSSNKKNILVSGKFLKNRKIRITESNRGGDVTFHTSGQLVGYPIIDLKKNKMKDIHKYMRKLEQVIIRLLSDYKILAENKAGYTGVWVNNEKIASIGIAARSWVTYHGFALNVNNKLDGFSFIHPCGIKGIKITSISNILNRSITIKQIIPNLKKHFKEVMYKNS